MTARALYKPRPPGTLKYAVAQLVEAIGVDRCADLLGRSRTQVYRYTDPEEGEHLSVDQLRVLERDAGRPIVTGFLAAEAGCVLVDLSIDGQGEACISRDFAAIGQETGRLFGRLHEVLADGVVTPAEAGLLREKVRKTVAALMAADQGLRARMEGGR